MVDAHDLTFPHRVYRFVSGMTMLLTAVLLFAAIVGEATFTIGVLLTAGCIVLIAWDWLWATYGYGRRTGSGGPS